MAEQKLHSKRTMNPKIQKSINKKSKVKIIKKSMNVFDTLLRKNKRRVHSSKRKFSFLRCKRDRKLLKCGRSRKHMREEEKTVCLLSC